jgi:hypothetical protein
MGLTFITQRTVTNGSSMTASEDERFSSPAASRAPDRVSTL